jgi:hypothetical protein
MKKILASILFILASCVITSEAQSAVLFSDNFDEGANTAWGNELGSWYANNGVYDSKYPNNNPPTYSSVTTLTNLQDFTVDVDINDLSDGGIYLRSQDNWHGVLLVTGGYGNSYNGLYWHVVNGGYSSVLNAVDIPGLHGSDVHITVKVEGNTYSAYVNGELKTTLTDSTFTSGKVALYDFSGQSFDNFAISDSSPAPEPSSLILGIMSLSGLLGLKKRK